MVRVVIHGVEYVILFPGSRNRPGNFPGFEVSGASGRNRRKPSSIGHFRFSFVKERKIAECQKPNLHIAIQL